MNIAPRSFFDPIYADSINHPEERCGFLRYAESYFNFGQMGYKILPFENNSNSIKLEESHENRPSWLGIACRVAAYFTFLIPFIMFVGKYIYRKLNKFVMKQPTAMDAFNQARTILSLLKNNELKDKYLARYACVFAKVDREAAHSIATSVKGRAWRNEALVKVAEAFAEDNLDKALEIIEHIEADALKQLDNSLLIKALTNVAAARAKTNCVESLEIASSLSKYGVHYQEKALAKIAYSIAPQNGEKAFSIINGLTLDYIKAKALAKIAKVAPENALLTAESLDDNGLSFYKVVKILAKQSPSNALKLVPFIQDDQRKEAVLAKIVDTIASIDGEEAQVIANLIKTARYKLFADLSLIKARASQNPKQAMDSFIKLREKISILERGYTMRIVKTLVAIDPNIACEFAKSLKNAIDFNQGKKQADVLLMITKTLAKISPKAAFQLAKEFVDQKLKIAALLTIAKEIL